MTKLKVALAFSCAVLCCIGFTSVRSIPSDNPTTNVPAQFDKLVDEYFNFYFEFHPTEATAAGFHQYDGELEDFSRSAVDAEVVKLKALQSRFDLLDPAKLAPMSAGDLELLKSTIKSRLLELGMIRMWKKDPDLCTSGVTRSIYLIIKRNFAPPEVRLRSVIAREGAIPGAIVAARQNLENPPKIYTEIALEQMPGMIDFFRKDVPEAFAEVKDAQLVAEFQHSNAAVFDALRKYQIFLRDDLLPISKGDFRIGAENYRKKLLADEMVDIPLDRLEEMGYADLRRNQQRLKETAEQIDPKHSPREVLAELGKDHPAPDHLLQSFRDILGSLRQFIEQKQIVSIPSQVLPIVQETPPFMRATTTASMDIPGAYEMKATEALLSVTLPQPGWKPQRREEWMEGFNRGTILSTAVHEAYPGHYTQFLWVQHAPSKVRKLIAVGSNAEGWAHYCEQMMLDEGYGGGDPKLRLGQLQDALLRDARFIVGIEMHTGHMTLEQAREFFIREGYQTPPIAEVESKRGSGDPTYLVYTLGKLQILKLRDDFKKKEKGNFTLKDFHDRFMGQGVVPLKLLRKALLGDDSPTL
jgi:uncharacterized protein (DUF885 family)